MSTARGDSLGPIGTFPSLVKYLRDELGWPIESEDFEELTFDYEPEELGLDPKIAVKIASIKQLRPLASNQIWGIFFVKFHPRRLPVVALRRILRALVIKKRASANRSEQPAWDRNDLLFISAYGEEDERQITFAHFSEGEHGDLPTLKVLGWDNADTALKLDHVHATLTENLRWPEDESAVDAWRRQWSSAFTLRHGEVITTSKRLAERLAELATAIRKRVRAILAIESEKGPFRKVMKAFQDALIHDLNDDGFSDMYAQTITYGLLSARVSRPAGLVADDAAQMVPNTNPFLRELMEEFLRIGGRRRNGNGTGIDFDELGVNDVVEVLRDANMEAVLRDFGRDRPGEDPVIHFYEDFMLVYDKVQKVKRGIFYTPRPVVSFIVRSVDEILREEFGLPLGLADTTTWGEMAERHKGQSTFAIPKGVKPTDPFVQILDPAVGTGTFLVEVIDLVHQRMREHWLAEEHLELQLPRLWDEYVSDHLLPRLYGFELMMAPYAVCHMKVGLKLAATGYRFRSSQRLRVYLTNSLEPPHDLSEMLEFVAPFLAHEARAANIVKSAMRPTVVIGNPPYAGESANPSQNPDRSLSFIGRLLQSYFVVDGQPLGERNSKWLHDDYVKFIRFAAYLLSVSGAGIFGYITNHSFTFNPTFRGMRQHLLNLYRQFNILNLHGSMKLREQSPDGSADENVFDIEPGTAITLGANLTSIAGRLRYTDLWGTRASKYAALISSQISSVNWRSVEPCSPFYFLFPQSRALDEEFQGFAALSEMFPLKNTGIITKRDALTIHYTEEELWTTLTAFVSCPIDEAYERFGLPDDVRDWTVRRAQEDLRITGLTRKRISRIVYRPFDVRYSYYTGNSRGFVGWPVDRIYRHMVAGHNLALCVGRAGQAVAQDEWNIVLCTEHMTEFNLFRRGGNVVFPLYVYEDKGSLKHKIKAGHRVANLAAGMERLVENKFGSGEDGVERFFCYVYAILHSREYRERYAGLLQYDFPRIPMNATRELALRLAGLGADLVAQHILEAPGVDRSVGIYFGPANPVVEKVSYCDATVWLDKKKTLGFREVTEEAWRFEIGGYQVCEKWLKDRQARGGRSPRPARVLSEADIAHYRRVVVAINETIRIIAEIDEVIEAHGGWPGAFVTEPIK